MLQATGLGIAYNGKHAVMELSQIPKGRTTGYLRCRPSAGQHHLTAAAARQSMLVRLLLIYEVDS